MFSNPIGNIDNDTESKLEIYIIYIYIYTIKPFSLHPPIYFRETEGTLLRGSCGAVPFGAVNALGGFSLQNWRFSAPRLGGFSLGIHLGALFYVKFAVWSHELVCPKVHVSLFSIKGHGLEEPSFKVE